MHISTNRFNGTVLCSFCGNCIKWESTSYSNTIEKYDTNTTQNTTYCTKKIQIQRGVMRSFTGNCSSSLRWELTIGAAEFHQSTDQKHSHDWANTILTIEQIHPFLNFINPFLWRNWANMIFSISKFVLWRSCQFRFKCNLMRFDIQANAVPSHPR